jgi:timeless
MNLTNPPLLVYEEELPQEKVSRNYYIELLHLLQNTKEAFNDPEFWLVVRSKLEVTFKIVISHYSTNLSIYHLI